CDTEETAARRMDRSWALARHMTGSPPTPLLQRNKHERAFAHIIGETEANPLPAPAREPCTPIGLSLRPQSGGAARFPPGYLAPRGILTHAVPTNTRPNSRALLFGGLRGIDGGDAGCYHMGHQIRLANHETHRRYARCTGHRL